ncbi:L-threonine-O-3-phosphate decarboxylase [Rubidibacter lacunae KORDI 51-2]|uniref:threonine-phosphate decarboxylase n=1 Tax=Rubidibacter lacunae KORDI 51-2 TaxID=582515 RepID=U5DEV9_9CHRO|nr:threonine-phosphate decarboxylase CobD [Rubidibacter lacunae]ERN43033.1 L-threonine-O-3-phosphate decarboxylase [Rubidibacter lacunae KORDI 51-2]
MLPSSDDRVRLVPALSGHPRHGGNLFWAARLAGCPPESLTDFSASINPLGPPPNAIAAVQAAVCKLTAYPDPSYSRLRAVLGAQHGMEPEWVLPGNGAAELLSWAARELAELDAVETIVPGFADYERALQAFGGRMRSRRLVLETPEAIAATELPLPDVILRAGTGGDRVGLLINNPHNPTGKSFARSELLAALEHYALVVVDEAFIDFLPPDLQPSVVTEIASHPNLVVLRSLTKFYSLPGLRLGYAIAHPQRLQRWQQWRDPWPVNILAAAAGEAIVGDTAFQVRTRAWLPLERERLREGLAELPGLEPLASTTNFLLVRSRRSVLELQEQLLVRHRLLIRHCTTFPELGDRYFRTAVRDRADNDRLVAALADVLADGGHDSV